MTYLSNVKGCYPVPNFFFMSEKSLQVLTNNSYTLKKYTFAPENSLSGEV